MAQGDYNIQNQGFPAFRSDLNSTLEAINTSNSGTSRPSSAVAGTIWLDTTSATTPTLKFYDGSDDISLAQLDYSANTVNWFDSISGSISWQSIKTSGFTAVAGEGYFCNTTSAAFTVTLPSSASVGDTIQIIDYAGTFNTNNLTLTSTLDINGSTNDRTLTTNRESITIVYSDATQGWVASSGVNSGDQGLDPDTYTAEYLVVAGGGGGGANSGGGGGAGGLLTNYGTSTITLFQDGVYTATVGAGGAASVPSNKGGDGGDSILSGTGITTITAIGGGGGATQNTGGRDGGSGGGGGYIGSGGDGTVGQGNNGGTSSGTTAPEYGGAGGGGAGAVGTGGSGSVAGNGGNGLANSITGASVTYAGGGGGGVAVTNGNAGTGGTGGGGDGTATGTAGNGTDGLGGGGGGRGANDAPNVSGTGGSGVVILRVPTASYSSTTTGSPTVTTDGTDTIIKFTGSGTYTA